MAGCGMAAVARPRPSSYEITVIASDRPMDSIPLDLRGLKCPLPVLRVRKALAAARAGSLLVVQCTDPLAAIDLPNLARETGDIIEQQGDADGALVFHIRKAA